MQVFANSKRRFHSFHRILCDTLKKSTDKNLIIVALLLKGYSKPSSYGLMAKCALYLKCLEGSNNSLATFLCANPSNQRFNDLLNQNGVSLEGKNKSSLAA